MADTTQGSGEHPNGRKAMDTMVRDLRQSGVSSRQAEKIARDTALRHDRGQGAKR